MTRQNKVSVIAISVFALCLVAIFCINDAINTHEGYVKAAQLAAAKEACTLDPKAFMNSVNIWRAETGAPQLIYSAQLETGANARLADMKQGQYYGHVNPVTKEQSYTMVKKYAPAATSEYEVLDGPNSASQALADFKNSPDHYNALVNPRMLYFAAVAVYQPQSWAEYDNTGNLEIEAGQVHGNCLVLGELADNSEVGTESVTTTASPPKTSALNLSRPTSYVPTSSANFTYTAPVTPTCDQDQLAQVKANRDDLASQFASLHQTAIDTLKTHLPVASGGTGTGTPWSQEQYQIAVLQENQRYSQQSTDLVNSYNAALKQIHC